MLYSLDHKYNHSQCLHLLGKDCNEKKFFKY